MCILHVRKEQERIKYTYMVSIFQHTCVPGKTYHGVYNEFEEAGQTPYGPMKDEFAGKGGSSKAQPVSGHDLLSLSLQSLDDTASSSP